MFNPSLEIQTTDNYIDWTSLSVVNLEGITFSSRTIPTGTESDIDIATIRIKEMSKLYTESKRLGVITNIITSILKK